MLGVVVGYVAMEVWVMATLALAGRLVGADFAVGPEGTGVTAGWLAINIPLSFVGAYIGGSFAQRLGREHGSVTVRVLAGVVVAVGLVTAFTRPADPTAPTWYTFVIPFLGAAGILLGGRRRASQ